MKKPPPPKTEAEWSAYRVSLNCQVGRDILQLKVKSPPNVPVIEFALFSMFHAIEELSKQITTNQHTQ